MTSGREGRSKPRDGLVARNRLRRAGRAHVDSAKMRATRTACQESNVSKHQEQIIAAAKGKVDEEILGAAWGKPRGASTAGAGAGVIVSEIGARWSGKQHKGAEAAGIELANPGAVAITASNLVTMKVKVSAMGAIKEVTEVLSVVPLSDVDSLEVKRAGLTGVMEITARGGTFKLEGKPGDMKELVQVFEQAKAAAPPAVA
jgi:hypothetical protein